MNRRIYLDLDSDRYLKSVFQLGTDEDVDIPYVVSIKDLDLSGCRINAYRWNGESLVFDENRYGELVSRQQQNDAEIAHIKRMDSARQEITDAVLTASINSVDVDDATALRWIDFYPAWNGGVEYTTGYKVQFDSRLWRCLQAHTSQSGWEPENVASLWEEICETHSGTTDDPIPYNNNMTLENGKYYSQFGITYHCIRDTGAPVYNNLADLVGLYVEIA